jgi:hypothetical protein
LESLAVFAVKTCFDVFDPQFAGIVFEDA